MMIGFLHFVLGRILPKVPFWRQRRHLAVSRNLHIQSFRLSSGTRQFVNGRVQGMMLHALHLEFDMNFDERMSPFENRACGFCRLPYPGFSGTQFACHSAEAAAGNPNGSGARRGGSVTPAGRKRLSELMKNPWAERRRKAKIAERCNTYDAIPKWTVIGWGVRALRANSPSYGIKAALSACTTRHCRRRSCSYRYRARIDEVAPTVIDDRWRETAVSNHQHAELVGTSLRWRSRTSQCARGFRALSALGLV
jgi:hypothetical protein